MTLKTALNTHRRVPPAVVGMLCLMGAVFSLWLAAGPAENLPVDPRELETAMGEARASAKATEALLAKFQDVADGKLARERLNVELKREIESMKRRSDEKSAQRHSDIRRLRWASAALAGLLALFAATLVRDGLQSKSQGRSELGTLSR